MFLDKNIFYIRTMDQKFDLFSKQVKELNLSEFEVECFIKVVMNYNCSRQEAKALFPVIYRNGHIKERFRKLRETVQKIGLNDFSGYKEERFLMLADDCIIPTPLQIVYDVNGQLIVKQGVDPEKINHVWGIACNGLYYECCLHMASLNLIKKRMCKKRCDIRLVKSSELKDLLPYLEAFSETVMILGTFNVDVDDWLEDDDYRSFWIDAPEQSKCWHPCALLFDKKVVQTSAHEESNQYVRFVVEANN